MSYESAEAYAAVFAHFGADDLPDSSVYPYSPVFPCTVEGHRVVVKRTRSTADAAQAIAAWTRQAAASGLPVVRPAPTSMPNPADVNSQHWVAYPFVEGDAYSGTDEQVAAAGDLLGRIHTVNTEATVPLFSWPDPDADSVAEDQEALAKVVGPHSAAAAASLSALVARFPQGILPAVRAAALPESTIITDYKANNLIYTDDGPVLIDPDNADTGPRLFDLAFAALQFHSEHPSAPGRMFDQGEWATFAGAYLRHVQLTENERELWPTVLEYVLSEESVWTLVESDDWNDERERAFLLDLALADAGRFPLPA